MTGISDSARAINAPCRPGASPRSLSRRLWKVPRAVGLLPHHRLRDAGQIRRSVFQIKETGFETDFSSACRSRTVPMSVNATELAAAIPVIIIITVDGAESATGSLSVCVAAWVELTNRTISTVSARAMFLPHLCVGLDGGQVEIIRQEDALPALLAGAQKWLSTLWRY